MDNLPETEFPDLREYLFVDNARVRMLVSQLRGGAPESSTSTSSRSQKLRLGLKALSTEHSKDRSSEDVIALSDLYVSMLEEDAEALGMLSDVSEEARTADFWKRGGNRKLLKPGMLIRVTASTRLMDPRSITEIWRNFDAVAGVGDQELGPLLDTVNALYGDHLSLSVMPRGAESPTKAFLGVIDHGIEFPTLDRASLFSRLDPNGTELTSILQIARVPQQSEDRMSPKQLAMKFNSALRTSNSDRLDRAVLDEFLMAIMELTEVYGLQSAPQWPSLAVIPLSVYRQVPTWSE